MVSTGRRLPLHRKAPSTPLAGVTSSRVVCSRAMQSQSSEVRALLAERDPELLLAIDEVDRTLIRSSLDHAPWERLRDSFEQHDTLQEMARCLRSGSAR